MSIGLSTTAALDPILKGAHVKDLAVAHVLEHLTRQRSAPAGSAIDDDGLGRFKLLVVVRRRGVGAESNMPRE